METSGSTDTARRIGTTHATTAVRIRTATPIANDNPSVRVTPYSMFSRSLVPQRAPTRSDQRSYQRHHHAARQHGFRDRRACRAERDADTDLASLLRDCVGHDAIQPDRGEHEREYGERHEKRHREAGPAIERVMASSMFVTLGGDSAASD